MSGQKKQMSLGAFLMGAGHHVAAWRHPKANTAGNTDFAYFRHLAQTAERGKFDMIFFADGLALWGRDKSSVGSALAGGLEPITLLSALAAVTEKIGLAATVSTTYNEPFHVARKFASLDYLSGGRAAWNIVTSGTDAEAYNFGNEKNLAHSLRYDRAKEFLDVVKGLWDSWDDDAYINDKTNGVYADPDKVRYLDHKGPWFSVKGPLNIPRPPQGYPVLIQAGSSDAGQDFAARTAEAIFTAQQTLEEAQTFFASVKTQMLKFGRSPDELRIMPGISPVLGATEQEAKEKEAQLQELVLPAVGLSLLSSNLNHDMSVYPLDGPVPDLPDPETNTNGVISRVKLVLELARRENLTIRELSKRVAGARGHKTFVGTPIQLADLMEEWFEKEGCDGFNIMPPTLPGGLEEFVDHVVPELQRRGIFRSEYTGNTLRDHLGLARPVNKHKQAQSIRH